MLQHNLCVRDNAGPSGKVDLVAYVAEEFQYQQLPELGRSDSAPAKTQ